MSFCCPVLCPGFYDRLFMLRECLYWCSVCSVSWLCFLLRIFSCHKLSISFRMSSGSHLTIKCCLSIRFVRTQHGYQFHNKHLALIIVTNVLSNDPEKARTNFSQFIWSCESCSRTSKMFRLCLEFSSVLLWGLLLTHVFHTLLSDSDEPVGHLCLLIHCCRSTIAPI